MDLQEIYNNLVDQYHPDALTDDFIAQLWAQAEAIAVNQRDTLADDLALAWISKHTKIEIDSPAYRELVRAFLQMGRTPAADAAPRPDAALVEALRRLVEFCERVWPPDEVQQEYAVKQARAALASVEAN